MLLPHPASPEVTTHPEQRARGASPEGAPCDDPAAGRRLSAPGGDHAGDRVLMRALDVARGELGATTRLHLSGEPVEAPAAHTVAPVVDPTTGERLASLVVPEEAASDGVRLLARLIGDRLAGREERYREQRRLREQMGGLLAPGGLEAAFQPIVSLEDSRVRGVEALARARDERGGPGQWLQAASALGMRAQLERLAVARALEGLEALPEGAFLAINVSPPVLASRAVTPLLAAAPLDRVVIELTEHEAVPDYDGLNAELAPLRERGLRLAIDDVGAGFASMRHVLRTRPEIIKLDRAFVVDLTSDAPSEALISSLCDFAGAIDATVVAEGVETAEEEGTVRALGVSWAQGHRFGRPVPLGAGARLAS